MAVGDIYLQTLSGMGQGQVIQNTFHWLVDIDGAPSALAAALHTWATGTFMPAAQAVQGDAFEWQKSSVQKIWPLPVFVADDDAVSMAGHVATPLLPVEVAAVLKR